MPHRSRKTHNWLAIFTATLALLLIVSSFLINRQQPNKPFPIRGMGNLPLPSGEGLVAGVAQDKTSSKDITIDTSNWKKYRDPIYHFEIEYPSEWANPVSKKINDPDFDYEYQVSFGTVDTIAGNGIEGFTIYVFPTEKCATDSAGNQPKCATTKSTSSVESDSQQKIFEFSGKVYTYTIVPFIPDSNADQNFVRKLKLEIEEAQKTFTLNPDLKLIPQAKSQPNISKAPVQAPKAPVAPRRGRAGTLTGAVKSGGKLVCPHPNRKPMRSPNKGNHVDEDCCPDPDEWPNIACAYKPSDYSIMLH